ncbi:putative tRNA-dihydrouridine synthase [Hydrogenovibrio crunogenus]|uniref:tRNA-dihydrouridine synthase B n=1 Tax=Hydrogenovibrio crunogenus TaxID=39765 RepID=A0A4V1C8M5_9GAMM|nr:tRNA dihydrouridine synthase DusB [Hydrogenovibrio crunogenus]QBZ82424.1 putative tRNA-dihydrouridine synthase [Hydrogenovibrio crunogenus]
MMPLFDSDTPTIALAPMAGITDRIYRDICRETGASYAVSEMVASKKQLRESAKSSTRHADKTETSPRIVQLLGTQPDELVDAALWQQSQGADMIDLNMGCPAKKVCDVAAGSALMGQPELVADIFKSLTEAIDLPVTVKIRTGTDADNINAIEIAKLAQDSGLKAITIHGRTRVDKFNGQAEYDTIKAVKQAVEIPVIANGDICSPKEAQFVLKYTGSDGIMIGRAAQGYPWIFREIAHFLETGEFLPPPSLAEFQQVMTRHFSELETLYGKYLGHKIARKHLGWYSQYLPNGTELRKRFNRLESTQAQLNLINHYFDTL